MTPGPIRLPGGQAVVCKHDTLAICPDPSRSWWVHCHNGQHLCRPAHPPHPAGPYVAEPYILPPEGAWTTPTPASCSPAATSPSGPGSASSASPPPGGTDG